MDEDKPKDIKEYKKWLKDNHGVEITSRSQTYYKSVTNNIYSDFKTSSFWLFCGRSYI